MIITWVISGASLHDIIAINRTSCHAHAVLAGLAGGTTILINLPIAVIVFAVARLCCGSATASAA
jgi:hypothetical protein